MALEEKDKLKSIREEKSYYKGLSEIYYYRATEELKLTQSLMVILGCIMDMETDLILYKAKFGETESFKKSISRIEILLKEVSTVSTVQTENYMLRKLLKDQRQEIELLKNIIFESTKKNENTSAL